MLEQRETRSKERLELIKLREKIYKEKEQKLGKPTILELKVNQAKQQLVQPLDEGEKERQVVKVGRRFQDCKPVNPQSLQDPIHANSRIIEEMEERSPNGSSPRTSRTVEAYMPVVWVVLRETQTNH